MNLVKFFRGPKSSYQGSTTHKDVIYFATDTHELYMNNDSYGDPVKSIVFSEISSGQDKGKVLATITLSSGKTFADLDTQCYGRAEIDSIISDINSANTSLGTRMTTAEGRIDTLSAGSGTEGSVAYQIAQIVNENQNGSIDTLNEIASWIINDTTGAAKMAADIETLKTGKVDKVAGKQLSTEDYTTAEKTKLASIEAGAQVNPTNVSEFTNDAGYLVEDDLMEDVINANGHAYVDLGLPSGTKWATMNVGATKPEEYGLYFAWGDTQGYADASTKAFSWADYKYGNYDSSATDKGMTKYNATDGKTVLDTEDDAAAANWGGSWKMPTEAQCEELFDNTNKEWTTVNSVSGYKFINKTDSSKYIFIPAAGYCDGGSVNNVGDYGLVWASSLGSSNVGRALGVYFSSDGGGVDNGNRYRGFSVRGVLSPSKAPKYASATDANATNDRLTAISGQEGNTYTARNTEDASFIKNATNIQDALNKLDDASMALTTLLTWHEYKAAPVAQNAFYRIGSIPGYASLVNSNGETIIVNDTQFVLDVNANSWSTYSASDGELAGTLREEFGTQTYDAGGDTISGGRTEFEINGETIVYDGSAFTPAISEWSAV